LKAFKAMFVFALALAVSASAFAETQNVKVSGSLDAYAIARDNFDLNSGNDIGSLAPGAALTGGTATQRSDGDTYFMSITQVQVSADLTDNVSTVVNVINQRDWNADVFSAGGANATQEFDLMLDLAYVQMKEIFYAPLTLTIGRQDIVFGRGFIVGWNPQDPANSIQADEFTQIQSFDAIRATLDFNPWTVDLVYSKIDENSHNPEDDRDLWIANVNYKFAEYNAVAEGYWVGDIDRAGPNVGGATRTSDTHTVGGRVQFDPITQMTLGAELAYQFGDYAATTGPIRDRSALGMDIFAEYRFDYVWKPMLGLQFVHLSGDDNLGATTEEYGSWNGSFRLPVYGWIHDYKETYFQTAQTTDQVAGQNQNHISVYGSMNPLEDLKLTANWWWFWNDEDVAGAGTSTLNEDIGTELDLAAIYSYTEDVTFTFMANWFFAGDQYLSPNDDTASEYITEVKVVF